MLLEADFGDRSVEPWRRPRTRISNLLKLGTTKRQAILTGISWKGYWRLSLAQLAVGIDFGDAYGNDERVVKAAGIVVGS